MHVHIFGHCQRKRLVHLYKACPESIRPFWISREPAAWPWCNLAASQRRPYYPSVNSHSPVGLVSQQWDAVNWACVLCDRHIHKSHYFQWWFLVLWKVRHHREPNLGCRGLTYQDDVMLCRKSLHESCRLGRRIVVMKMICSFCHCECDGYTVHKLSQRRLTADWLGPRESDCSRMNSKLSSDWLLSYIKATRPVLKIFKMDGYFPDSPCILPVISTVLLMVLWGVLKKIFNVSG